MKRVRVDATRGRGLSFGVRSTLAALALMLPTIASAQDPDALIGDLASFWDIPLGAHALELDPAFFSQYACGTNGGPPSIVIADWSEYARCPVEEATGYHEVQFRYDDEPEYFARANDIRHLIATYEGVKLFTIDAIISALFDEDGFLMGLRAVTDPRVDEQERLRSISLGGFLIARFGTDRWDCVELPQVEGETPIGGRYEKDLCTQSTESMDLLLESHFYRKPGQYAVNPRNPAETTQGLFDSRVRFEMFLNQPIEDREARIAEVLANPREPSEAELNRERAMDCPGCDLAGIDLKRQDLTGANLAGADLTGANLHGAILIQADLTGANLAEANLNRSNMRQALLTEANMVDVLMFGAVLDGADMAGADLTGTRAQESRMTRVNLDGAKAAAVDFSRARLASVSAIETNFGGSWFFDAQMTRGDFTGADFTWTVMQSAVLTNANLSDANFNTADLILADLRGATLTNTDFTDARMTRVNLIDTNREDALLENAFDVP